MLPCCVGNMWKAWARIHHFLRGSTKRAFFLPLHHIWKAKNDNPLATPFAESLCSLCVFSKSNQNSNWGTNFSRWNHCICMDMRCNEESNPSLNQKLRFMLLKNCFRSLILGGQIIVPVKDRKWRESIVSFHKMLKKSQEAVSFALCFPLFLTPSLLLLTISKLKRSWIVSLRPPLLTGC